MTATPHQAQDVHTGTPMPRLAWIAGSILAITLGHFATPMHLEGVHDLLQRLYYLPIILGGLWFGLRGGILSATATSVLFLPHIFMQWGGARAENLEKFLELILFVVVGAITGVLADRLRTALDGQRRAYASLRERSTQLLEAEEQLGRSERLAALGALSAELAHEIRNPLGTVKVTAEVFRDRLKPEDPLSELAHNLCKEASRLEGVVESCLAMARQRSEGTVPGDVASAIDEVLAATQPEAQRVNVNIVVDASGTAPKVRAPQVSLRRVFLNLTQNALQAMPRGGQLSISTDITPNRVRVTFQDTGTGIAPGDEAKLFQPFFTRRQGGTGLGLAISRRLVAVAGGTLDAQSEAGRGATFVVELPTATELS